MAIPRLGGLGILVGALCGGLVFRFTVGRSGDVSGELLPLLAGSLAMFGLGFFDDLHPIRARTKLVLQVMVAATAVISGLRIETVSAPFGHGSLALGWLGPMVSVAFLVAVTNVINLIDGADGLAGGIVLMVVAFLGFAAWQGQAWMTVGVCAAVAGALGGFLRYNLPPARVYLGDGGAYGLGFLLAGTALLTSQKGTLLATLLAACVALGVPLIDTLVAVGRRAVSGLPLFRPDRGHVHHVLRRLGLRSRTLVIVLYLATLGCLGLAVLILRWGMLAVPLAAAAVLFSVVVLLRLAVRSLNWDGLRHWFTDRTALRRQVRHAVKQGRQLAAQVKRGEPLARRWERFVWLCGSMRFQQAELHSNGARLVWCSERPSSGALLGQVWEEEVCLGPRGSTRLRLLGCATSLTEPQFRLLAELAAEAWVTMEEASASAKRQLSFQRSAAGVGRSGGS